MEIKPILKTLLRNKIGVAVIAAQVALTLAIASNVFYIVRDRVAAARQPSGADEANVFRIRVSSYRDIADPVAQQKIDEAAALLEPLLARRRFHHGEFGALAGAQIVVLLARGDQASARSWLEMWAAADSEHPEIAGWRRRLAASAG